MCRVYTTRLIDHNAIFAAAVDKRVFTVGNLHTGAGCSQQPPLRPQTGKTFFFSAAKDCFYFVFFQSLVVNTPRIFTSALTSFELTF